ncbi:MAG: long-chain-fatty-acid--CoA ligase [Proteobacteria bacterium]|nr:long-chain-fatty-acid--CoA ligase [Pseudomonadota bacterium]MDA1150218.1 long-chain-fatty-acid--CoA ligase [Pseudomonadota bacterium]MDP4924288.1 long-chain-fatty-acid--CoA ligase [Alphaproteobacteria bacterium]
MSSEFSLLIKTLLNGPIQQAPQQQIISDGLGSYSYVEFINRLSRFGQLLRRFGVGRGDVVAIMDWDTHRYLESFFAVPMLGATLHTVNIRLSPSQIAYTIDHADDDVILVHVDFLPLLEEVMPQVKRDVRLIIMRDAPDRELPHTTLQIEAILDELFLEADSDFSFPNFDENTRATTFYTTGTTGDPKAVAYSHRQLVLHTMGILATLGPMSASNRFHNRDVYMPVTPMFHVHGWGFPYAATMLGLKQIYPGRYVPNRLMELVCEHRVTFSHCVPTILHMLLGCNAAASADLSNWKVVIGGSALPRGLAEQALARGINLFSAYGLSETCPFLTVAHLDPNDEGDIEARLKTGRPAAMVEIRVVDAVMNDVPRDGKSVGEIVARAPWLNEAYLKDEVATKALWHGGYMHTGDVGKFDERGNLIITDRVKDVIKSGGEWISSLTLESIASTVPGVAEVAAIGIPDSRWGERPMLVVVQDNSNQTTASDRKNIIQEMIKIAYQEAIAAGVISKWASPNRIDIVDKIAKTSVGKIDKKTLRTTILNAET